MLRHVVLLDWTPDVTEEQKYNLTEALDRLPTLIPTIRDYRFGPDAGINKGTFDFALVARAGAALLAPFLAAPRTSVALVAVAAPLGRADFFASSARSSGARTPCRLATTDQYMPPTPWGRGGRSISAFGPHRRRGGG